MTELGLRDRSRLKRRAAIERSALRLFAEQGYEATTIAQIADDAEVSPRTVSLHFPTKLDLALSYMAESAQRFTDAMDDRTEGEQTLDVMRRWIEGEIADHDEVRTLHNEMVRANPVLRGAQTPEALEGRRAVVRSLARDLNRGPDDVVVQLVGGAIEGVLGVLSELRDTEVDPLAALLVALPMLQALASSTRHKKGAR